MSRTPDVRPDVSPVAVRLTRSRTSDAQSYARLAPVSRKPVTSVSRTPG
ncbi:hypothetical protein [Streptomyces sp. NPDC001530]